MPSIVHVTPCTSRPPVPLAAVVSVRRTRVPPWNTRSTLPIVTVSPSRRTALVHPRTVDEGPVDAAVVADLRAACAVRDQGRVVTRCENVRDDDVVVGVAADLDRPGGRIGGVVRLQDLEHARREVALARARSGRRAHRRHRFQRGRGKAGCRHAGLGDRLAHRGRHAGGLSLRNRCTRAAVHSGNAAAGLTGNPAADQTGRPAGVTWAVGPSAAAGSARCRWVGL